MAIALVSSVSKQSTGSGGAGTTSAIDTTGSTLLVLAAGYIVSSTNTAPLPTVSDSKSNIWQVVNMSAPGAGAGQLALFAAINPTVGSGHTFSCTVGFSSVAVAAFSGTHATFPTGSSRGASSTTNTSLATGSLTPPINNTLLIAALAYRDTTTVSISGGFTIAEQQPFASGSANGVVLAYLIQTSAAAANPSFSWTNSSSADGAVLAVFQPPVSGGSGGASAYGFA